MVREKSPGLKILWVWTLGTAAILVTTVARMRMRDMENITNSDQQPSHNHQQTSSTDSFPVTDSFSVDEGDVSQHWESGFSSNLIFGRLYIICLIKFLNGRNCHIFTRNELALALDL
ncbi:unnamed protein product [Citrullus colocynthis]|uniref:Uncharacterized protein n=1 Tax=Citrullus colocynthis TaxID=252529 RepID=A0ABP0Z5L8_9ROSI